MLATLGEVGIVSNQVQVLPLRCRPRSTWSLMLYPVFSHRLSATHKNGTCLQTVQHQAPDLWLLRKLPYYPKSCRTLITDLLFSAEVFYQTNGWARNFPIYTALL